jgi:hypothetical protein
MRPSIVFGISGLSSGGDCSSTLGLISMVPLQHAVRSLLKRPTRKKSQGCRALPNEQSRGGGRRREEQPAGADRAGGAVQLEDIAQRIKVTLPVAETGAMLEELDGRPQRQSSTPPRETGGHSRQSFSLLHESNGRRQICQEHHGRSIHPLSKSEPERFALALREQLTPGRCNGGRPG